MSKPIHLLENYYAKVVDDSSIFEIMRKNRTIMFPNSVDFHSGKVLSKAEIEKLKTRAHQTPQPTRLNYIIEQKKELVGWCTAYQKDVDEWYMHNTGIFSQHRRKGLYSAVLKLMIDYATEQAYIKITSVHNATNNAVIIPKLKAGFIISGCHLSERFGMMVKLSYYPNKAVQSVVEFRSGEKRLPKDLAPHLPLIET